MNTDARTIFAVSSGLPPAAIGVIRVSGPDAGSAMRAMIHREVVPRRASLARLYGASDDLLDEALVLWFPGPDTATGEDLLELHCHGGRAVLAAVCAELDRMEGLRPAIEGEFTRRSFANGRIDLAEAEGLADLLEAETELQRAAAMNTASGVLSSIVEGWRETVLHLSAQVEAALDFSDEDDVTELPESFPSLIAELLHELTQWLERPRSERLKDGFRVVLAGPPNSGKSTLFNVLIESEAAITSPIAGTTRDVIERSVSIAGVPFVFVDTAGLRDEGAEEIEAIGIKRAHSELGRADCVLWLGTQGDGPRNAWEISARKDCADFTPKDSAKHTVSAVTGDGITELKDALVEHARSSLPKPGEAALNSRQFDHLNAAAQHLLSAREQSDFLLLGEDLRRTRLAFDQLVGRATTEDMLDALFGRFCIGK